MGKIFAKIITIATLLVLTGSAFNLIPIAKSAPPSDASWQLTVSGLVKNPLTLNWTELTALPTATVAAALICVDFPSRILMQGYWTGVKLQTLFDMANPSQSVVKVAFYAADGYSTDLTIETAKNEDVILAYEINDTALNDLRLVVPGKWGYKWISQVTSIELVDYNYLGKWESQGYSDEGDVASGGQTIRDLQSLPKLNSTSPPPATPTPSNPSSPTPSATTPPADQVTPTPEPSQEMSIPTEAIYAIALSVVAIVIAVALTFVRKKTK